MTYDFAKIEAKWQDRWKKEDTFSSSIDVEKPKFYLFEYPPYPSSNLHVGHVRNYTIGDVIARYKRMCGYNVLYTQGFDSFGLPNEIAAMENNIHPKIWTKKCIKEIKKQFLRLGYSYDADRYVTYHNEDYYKWTQWLFLLFLKKGLAYKKKAAANWCDKCETVLADDQVDDGRCWRCCEPVRIKYLDQWFFAIQKYADRLLTGLDKLDGWPERIKAVQRHWFGRSEGVEIFFEVREAAETLPVFTTTPELIYGCAFVAISPDHPLVLKLAEEKKIDKKVAEAVAAVKNLSSTLSDQKDRLTKGVNLNLQAWCPLTKKNYPIYAANYVAGAYGTGAIFGVPAHDKADYEFARRHKLPHASVVKPWAANDTAGGYLIPKKDDALINSKQYTGLSIKEAKEKITGYIIAKGFGAKATHYRVRDWLISRQRYWGPPIPVIYCDKCGVVPVPEDELPVKLPKSTNFDLPGNPLDRNAKFVECRCYHCRRPARRETDTMDTFVNSSWFYLRYCTPKHEDFMFEKDEVDYWMPADIAIGGVEHATTVYIHDRFVTKVLHDARLVPFDEPFLNLIAHELVIKDGKKMSKSLGNTVDPEEIIAKYGADALRLAILFIAPPEKKLDWKETMLKSCYRFLNNLWEFVDKNRDITSAYSIFPFKLEAAAEDQKNLFQKINQSIKEVTNDLEEYRFNTCIHSLIKLLKLLSDWQKATQESADGRDKILLAHGVRTLLLLLAPFAPHIAEESWEQSGFGDLVCRQSWPDSVQLAPETKKLVIQINGKIETVLDGALTSGTGRKEIEELAIDQQAIKDKLNQGKVLKKMLIEEPTHTILNIVMEEAPKLSKLVSS